MNREGNGRVMSSESMVAAAGGEVMDWRGRASSFVPLLRERAAEIDRLGMLPPDVLAALDEAGFYKVGIPARFGGLGPVSNCDQLDILVELARGNGSAAWLTLLAWPNSAFIGAFGETARDEVLSTRHVGPLVAGSLINPAHARGIGRPVNGGLMVRGSWMFSSGVRHCAWLVAGVSWVDGDGVEKRGLTLIPKGDFEIADDWHVEGMMGTNSNTAHIDDEVLVPMHRVMPMEEFAAGAAVTVKEMPLPTAIVLGCAYGAIENFIDRAKRRSAWSTPYAKLADMASTQITVAKVRAAIGLVEASLRRSARAADLVAAGELELDPNEQAIMTFEKVHGAQLLRAATEELRLAMGSSTAALDDELGRFCRDIRVICLQGNVRHDWTAEALGKALFDIAPASPMLFLDNAVIGGKTAAKAR